MGPGIASGYDRARHVLDPGATVAHWPAHKVSVTGVAQMR